MVSTPAFGPGPTLVSTPSLPAPPSMQMSPSAAGPSSGMTPPAAAGTKPARMTPQTAPGTLNGPPSGNNHAIPLSARRAESLDMLSVERRGQGTEQPELAQRNRVFSIPDAPTFRPTEEEFRDPMQYIRKIAPEGSKYGIVKIIPPDSWNPPFAIDTQRFHFRTRRQELSSVEGGNRVNNDYLDQLAKFHKQNGHNLNRFPSVDKRPLDLYRLKRTVERKGGFESVCKGKRWAEVGRDLGYSGKIMSSLSTSLKNSYQKWLLPYEDYLRHAKPGVLQQHELERGGPYTPSPGPSPAKKSMNTTPSGSFHETPTMQATAALHSSIHGPSPQHMSPMPPQDHLQTQPPQPQPVPSTSGGFTAVNAGEFTAVNAASPPSSFTSVNGFHSNTATPQHPSEPPPQAPNAVRPQPAPYTNGTPTLKRQHSESILSAEEIDAMNRRSKRMRKEVPTVAGSNMHHSRMAAARYQPGKGREAFRHGEMCEICGRSDDPLRFVTCATCDALYHFYCCEPPLKQRPEYEFHCPKCLVGNNDYGFEEGDVYSLSGFQRKANEFKQYHFNNLPPQFNPFSDGRRYLEEIDVEREFWRLVENFHDSTEVEYGADIHSTTHGSGFPTIEKQPRDPYSTDPWNLNILPLDKDSLFRHIKSDISGMTVPWLYVGMVFSTFCWHNEDHFAYSANYQHFGQTKTWYGIPADDTDKFERAMREEVPELFETQPDLLFQLVTLAKPEKLRKAGVRVYALDQRAGQFVITFPQAYHAGFNHGFNFNEAVNFAPPDWEPFGEAGVRRMRDYRKSPCFSHDELLLSAASRDHTIRTAKWLAPALERMRDAEQDARKYFLSGPDPESGLAQEEPYTGPRYESKPELINPDTEEEEVVCHFCKTFCYLSRYKCLKSGRHLCSLHAGSFECCDQVEHERYSGRDSAHVYCIRMTNDGLNKTVAKVVEKANTPESWAAKVDSELEDNPRPSLKHLRTLLSEGEKIQYDLPQLPDLKRFVDRCNEWVEDATNYITRKQQNRRKNEKAWRKNTVKAQEQEEREKALRNVDNIYRLLASADEISFDCAEITTLQERADSIKEFRQQAAHAMNNIPSTPTAEFKELVERGRDFHIDMTEIEQLESVVRRLEWNDKVTEMKPSLTSKRQEHTLDEIEKFVAEGKEVGVSDHHPDMQYFVEHRAQGELWEVKAKEVMSAEQVHYQQLDSLSAQAFSLAVRAETRNAVDLILKKQREVQEKIMSLVDRSKNEDFRLRPRYKEVKDVIEVIKDLQSKPTGTIDLEKETKRHEDWMRRGKKLFGKANAPLHILLQHMDIVRVRNDACFEITDKPRAPAEPSSRHVSPVEGMPISDGSNSSRDVFCICRKPEAGMMIECEVCHEWYHGKCLKIARGKVKDEDKYTCPICDWRVKIPRDATRPKLEELQNWQDDLETLPFQPDEEDCLNEIIDHAQTYRDYIKPIIHSDMATSPEEVPTMRFHLRKIEGADLLLAEETNFLKQELHKWAPVAPTAPPYQDHSQSTRKPRPTKQQKLMAQHGVTNPDDLPQQYKIKPHVAKRKASEAITKGQLPLQPAGNGASSASPIEQPIASPAMPLGSAALTGEKKFLTPLAIHVLGRLADASVVSKMLKAEPHMNRDKLYKMKMILETDSEIWEDLPTFQKRMKEMPTPSSHTPGAYHHESMSGRNHGSGQRQTSMSASSATHNRDSPLFQSSTDPYPAASGSGPEHHVPRLASPAQFGESPTFPRDHDPHSPPQNSSFDPTLFHDHSGSIFDSPSATLDNSDHKVPVSGPDDYPSAAGRNFFDSPKGTSAYPNVGLGLGSPGFGGSQQSAGNIDNVFADLVEDHDGDGIPGLDGAQDEKAAVQPDNAPEQGTAVARSVEQPARTEQLTVSKTEPEMDSGSSLRQLAEQSLGMSGLSSGENGAEKEE